MLNDSLFTRHLFAWICNKRIAFELTCQNDSRANYFRQVTPETNPADCKQMLYDTVIDVYEKRGKVEDVRAMRYNFGKMGLDGGLGVADYGLSIDKPTERNTHLETDLVFAIELAVYGDDVTGTMHLISLHLENRGSDLVYLGAYVGAYIEALAAAGENIMALVVGNFERKVLADLRNGVLVLDGIVWHSGLSHCRGGCAIVTVLGVANGPLETKLGPFMLAHILYRLNYATKPAVQTPNLNAEAAEGALAEIEWVAQVGGEYRPHA